MNFTSFPYSFTAALLALTGLATTASALTPVVLDDYSSDKSASYTTFRWFGATDATFAIDAGLFTPAENAGTGTGFYWTGGETLKPGDSISSVIRADKGTTRGTWTGLAVSTSSGSSDPYRIMINYFNGWKCVNEGGGLTAAFTPLGGAAPSWNTPGLLTLTRGTGEQQNVISWTLSQIDGVGLTGTGSLTMAEVTGDQGLYFGTASYAANAQESNNPAWDDLTYTEADTTPAAPYLAWAGDKVFTAANDENIPNGLAWILGAPTSTSANTLALLPVGTFDVNGATLQFSRVHDIGDAKLYVEYTTNLDSWTRVAIPANLDGSGLSLPDSDLTVDVARSTPNDAFTLRIPAVHASDGKFFCRLVASEN